MTVSTSNQRRIEREGMSSSPTKPTNATSKHIPELDGVRGLAILLVTLYRFSRDIPIDTRLGGLLHDALTLGSRGVELFFVLSGFLITGVLLDAKSTTNRYRNFLARRSLRIFPLYFVALTIFVVIIPILTGRDNPFEQATDKQFYLWTYLTNVHMSLAGQWNFGRLDHFWSLAVEEHFYLIWPTIIFTVPNRWLLRVATIGFVVCLSSRIAFAAMSQNDVATDVFSFFRFDAMLIGAMLIIHQRTRSDGNDRTVGINRLRIGLVVTALATLAIALFNRRFLTAAETAFPVTFALLIAVVLRPESRMNLGRLFRSSLLRSLGKYSYAMYVFQSPLIPLVAMLPSSMSVFERFGGDDSIIAHLCYIAFMFLLTYGIALLSWHILEKHCLRLKRHFKVA
ncbi:acyltransferase 3 [Rhodopirellula europaea SH398]|uniref:Acyltransferase 3 n=2 Tax=Rhodopirellula TaxID=265488 RepID=M5SMR0_9BACT|nr:acyltransferase 3 [Rhodopirellula europaea SH398]